MTKKILIISAICLSVSSLYGCRTLTAIDNVLSGFGSSNNSNNVSDNSIQKTTEYSGDSSSLCDEFLAYKKDKGELYASQEYVGKTLEFIGKVKDFGLGNGDPVVGISKNKTKVYYTDLFGITEKWHKGYKVKVKGVITGVYDPITAGDFGVYKCTIQLNFRSDNAKLNPPGSCSLRAGNYGRTLEVCLPKSDQTEVISTK